MLESATQDGGRSRRSNATDYIDPYVIHISLNNKTKQNKTEK